MDGKPCCDVLTDAWRLVLLLRVLVFALLRTLRGGPSVDNLLFTASELVMGEHTSLGVPAGVTKKSESDGAEEHSVK